MKKTYKIEVDCANCANKMEVAASKTDGIKEAVVNFMTQKMTVEFEDGADMESVMKSVLKNCKKVESDCEIYL
ncbi:MAG: cation transporter [Clostridia bacterium]|nr:cation transporter [Clostridia bacterium]